MLDIGNYIYIEFLLLSFSTLPSTPTLYALTSSDAYGSTCRPLAFVHIYPPSPIGSPEGYPQCWVGTPTA